MFSTRWGNLYRYVGIDSNKMKKKRVQERVSKKHEFSMDFRCQNGRLEMGKMRFAFDACCNLRGWGWVMKFDEKWVYKWRQNVIKIEALGVHGRVF
jgi:hypothetical protein